MSNQLSTWTQLDTAASIAPKNDDYSLLETANAAVTKLGSALASIASVVDLAAKVALGSDKILQTAIAENNSAYTRCIEDEKKYALSMYSNMLALDARMIEPGMTAESFQFLHEIGTAISVEKLYAALDSALSARLDDLVKSSALRAVGLLATSKDAASINFLLSHLDSDSPSQAAAAALSLGDVADSYSIPAMKAAITRVKWPSAKKELERSIVDVSNG